LNKKKVKHLALD